MDKGDVTDTRGIIEKIREAFVRDNVRKYDMVRAVLIGYFEEDEDKNLTMIKNAFFEQFYFEVIKQN